MDDSDRLQSEYYQTIAREFLQKRGAPFFLSPRDLALIADWEKRRIPLDAVLGGLALAFERRRSSPRRGGGVPLAFCAKDVEHAWEQAKARRAGGRSLRGPKTRSLKQNLARAAIQRFLSDIPAGFENLEGPYVRGLEILASETPDEPALERLDEETDDILWNRLTAEEREAGKRAAREEYQGRLAGDPGELSRARLVKSQRQKHRIPYFSLFYY